MKTVYLALVLAFLPLSIGYAQPRGTLEDALASYARGEFDESLQVLRPWAEKGNPIAQLLLGKVLLLQFVHGHDCREAKYWLTQSGETGNSEAAFQLGELFNNGECGASDQILALRWYLEAHRLGHADAPNAIGELFLAHASDQPDRMAQAKEWFLKGVVNWDWHASFHIAEMFRTGRGFRRDRVQAFKWLHIAYLQGPAYPGEKTLLLQARDSIREGVTPIQVERAYREAERIVDDMITPPHPSVSRLAVLHHLLEEAGAELQGAPARAKLGHTQG